MFQVPKDESREEFDRRILKSLVPGRSNSVGELRTKLADASDRYARGVLLLGPAGTGKSTLARVIGLLRYFSSLKLAFAHGIAILHDLRESAVAIH